MAEENKNENVKKNNEPRVKQNELIEFVAGLLLLAVGLFMLSMKVNVSTGHFGYSIGGFYIPTGVVTIPLIIGTIWYFVNRSLGSKIMIWLGILIIVASIVLSVRISFMTISLFEYLVMILLAAAGFGLILKTLFTDKKEK